MDFGQYSFYVQFLKSSVAGVVDKNLEFSCLNKFLFLSHFSIHILNSSCVTIYLIFYCTLNMLNNVYKYNEFCFKLDAFVFFYFGVEQFLLITFVSIWLRRRNLIFDLNRIFFRFKLERFNAGFFFQLIFNSFSVKQIN